MAIVINQKPSQRVLPVGQEILFSIIDSTTLVSHYNIRYFCDVYISESTKNDAVKVATLKTTPNAAGVGIFDVRRTVESELSPDYFLDVKMSQVLVKGTSGVEGAPIHHATKYSKAIDSTRQFYCKFYTKGTLGIGGASNVVGSSLDSDTHLVFNGYPDSNDRLFNTAGDYGYSMTDMNLYMENNTGRFLSDMPTQLYARANDFGVGGFIQSPKFYDPLYTGVYKIRYTFLDTSGSVLSSTEVNATTANGGSPHNFSTEVPERCKSYVGLYPANIKQFLTIPSGACCYGVKFLTSSNVAKSRTYIVNIVDECKFPVVRLCWLNKYGAWDYYNFNKKSVITTSSNKKYYNSSLGNWTGDKFKHNYHSGGKMAYSVSSKESMSLNSEYITEEDALWLEGLVNSSSVFLIKEGDGWSVGDTPVTEFTNFRDMIQPVIVTSSSLVRKTVVNDKLIMHSFNIEKSISNNTNRI